MANKCCVSKNFKKLTSLFRALAEPNRLAIFRHLCSCEASGAKQTNVNDIKECCDVDLSVVSRHLSVLKDAGVLTSEKKGKEVFYSLKGQELADLLRKLADQIEESIQKGEKL
ncbi:MAG: helix-turn-helix transcriptional regulator [Bdellovibrionaceae bacterium]|nr:helix-turn-helix transcriptional regulator [Pseudobdellovibrionaceae bacterium]